MASNFDARMHSYGIAYGRAGNRLAIVDGEGNSSHQNEANARLIAAAPDLLEALHAAKIALFNRDRNDLDQLAYDAVLLAIAKADGQS